jgi:cytochrome c oxidase subunit IV
MNSLYEAIIKMMQGFSKAILRFPLTVFCLICATILTCYMISLHKSPDLTIQKLMFAFLFGSFLGVTAQFACERFWHLAITRLVVYALSVLLILGYYLIISPVPAIDYGVRTRTSVAIFSLFCVFIWLPSFQGKFDFNSVALIHFKSAFTSILYAGVLASGLAAIIGAINILLFKVNSDWYGYMMAIVWILFATIYYLSLLPHFDSESETDHAYAGEASHYPRFLEILVSYIAVSLVAAYTLVLFAYFIKIGFTMKWPSGQLGPMILAYSAAGLVIYVLASRLKNRLAVLYQLIFPKVLIPVVIMQLISVYIRLNAYGVTESRYYVALFGIFSIVVGIVLSFRPVVKNSIIALFGAGFAILSVIPPVDAFTVSRVSQINRLENMLQAASVLVDGKISPKIDADITLRLETTSILNYLERRSYLKAVAWLPEDFEINKSMKRTFGYEPAYEYMSGTIDNFFADLNMQKPLNIDGYDVMLQAGAYRGMDLKENTDYDFEVRGFQYRLMLERLSPQEVRVSVHNLSGTELVSTGLYDFAASLTGVSKRPKEALGAEELTLDAEGNGCKLRIIFQNINITYGTGADAGADYNMFILIATPSLAKN